MDQDRDLQYALAALKASQPREARRWAEKAVVHDPESEDAWLVLAATASPRASLYYLQRALEINPDSKRAKQGMHWAQLRLIQGVQSSPSNENGLEHTQPRHLTQTIGRNEAAIDGVALRGYELPPAIEQTQPSRIRRRAISRTPPRRSRDHASGIQPFIIVMLLLAVGLIATWGTIQLVNVLIHSNLFLPARSAVAQVLETPTPIDTVQAILSTKITELASPPASLPPTETILPLLIPTEPPTATPVPAIQMIATPTSLPSPSKALPPGVSEGEFWVDVDLSAQRADAYLGSQLIQSFRVSTGLKLTPTVTGTFHIYVKYRYAHMSGPGYSLENVPYVMYFYKDYGLHGTYWHNNFGTRMSHGCVNFRTEDAAWVYKRAQIGTVVNIHR